MTREQFLFYEMRVSANRSAASYLIYMIDATGRRVSDIVKIIPDKTSPEDHLRGLRSSFNLRSEKFDNRASYYLVIADESGEQELQRIEFQIDIAATWDEYEFM